MFINSCANVGNKAKRFQAFLTYVDRYFVSQKNN